jgi:uncharacterized protein (TIGR00730 family)
MSSLTSICVYCGANEGADPAYAVAARSLGEAIAANGIRLVYGGGSIGLMGILARSVLANGGTVTGIIPQFLKDREVMLKEASELVVTADMHERKRIMAERADAFVALPGGLGTLEEVIEIATWAQLDRHAKPVLIVNLGGFWDSLITLFRRMTDDGFLKKPFMGEGHELPIRFCSDVADVIPTIRGALAGTAETVRPVRRTGSL